MHKPLHMPDCTQLQGGGLLPLLPLQVIACAPKLAVVRKRSAAHMVFCTNIAFSADGQRVLSASGDASVSVTDARGQPKKPISVKQ